MHLKPKREAEYFSKLDVDIETSYAAQSTRSRNLVSLSKSPRSTKCPCYLAYRTYLRGINDEM